MPMAARRVTPPEYKSEKKDGVNRNFGQKFDRNVQREAGSLTTARGRPDAKKKCLAKAPMG